MSIIRLAKRISLTENVDETISLIKSLNLHTVCEEAICPNLHECYSKKTATFIISGNICTRNCRFCAVKKGAPLPLDRDEPERIAYVVKQLGLKHVVITSVTRDDLDDGGAEQFVSTIKCIQAVNQIIIIEVLVPDFEGDRDAISSIIEAKPDIITHNIETVPQLYPRVKPKASYTRSLNLLKTIKDSTGLNDSSYSILTKSGIMVGLGETTNEIINVMNDLRKVKCDLFTIGQYLQPTKRQLSVEKYYNQEEFEYLYHTGLKSGFKQVKSGYFVRSSYAL